MLGRGMRLSGTARQSSCLIGARLSLARWKVFESGSTCGELCKSEHAIKSMRENFCLQIKSMWGSRTDGLERWRGIKRLRKNGVNSGRYAGWKVPDQYNPIVLWNPLISWGGFFLYVTSLSVLYTASSPQYKRACVRKRWTWWRTRQLQEERPAP